MPELRGRLLANQSLAELTWFRVGGPAQVLFTPSDEDDLAYFLAHLAEGVADHCRRRRLQSDRARRRYPWRGDPAVAARVRRNQRGRRYRQRGHRGARQARGGNGGGGEYRRHGILLRHSRHHRRRAADECRRQRQRDQGCAGRGHRHRPRRRPACVFQCRHEFRLPQQRRRSVDHFYLGALSRGHRRAGSDPRAHERGADPSRDRPADPRKDRRLDLQEPARPQRLETDRRRRLPRPARRRRTGVGNALQFPDQYR